MIFLPDAPATDDQVGTHGEIARSLASLVTGSSGGYIIGIEGSYGSGKSTVVQLFSDRCDPKLDDPWPSVEGLDVAVWQFDAWAHEGDSLRKTFMSRLRTFLASRWGLPTESHWDTVRREKTKIVKAPSLSEDGLGVLLALLAVPVGTAMLAAALRGYGGTPLLVGGFILGLLPILLVAAYLGKGSPEVVQEIVAVLTKQLGETQRQVKILDPAPDSVAFEASFTHLMKLALEEVPSRRLVLVLDNMDRVDAETASAIWSTLQTFVDATRTEAAWAKRLWVVLPYDPTAVMGTDDPSDRRASILQKAIRVRFDIPSPALPDWKRLFESLLISAEIDDGPDERFHAYLSLLAAEIGGTYPATPRLLTGIVNHIGVQRLTRRDEHSLPILAYHAALRATRPQDTSDDLFRQVVQGSIPSESAIRILGGECRVALAALLYSVSTETARNLLAISEVRSVLTDDGHVRHLLEQENALPYWYALSPLLSADIHQWTHQEPAKIFRFAALLDRIEAGESVPTHELGHLQRQIAKSCTHVPPHVPTGLQLDGLKGIMSWSTAPQRADTLAQVRAGFEAAFASEDLAEWPAQAYRRVREFNRLHSWAKASALDLRVPGLAKYLKIAEALVSASQDSPDLEGVELEDVSDMKKEEMKKEEMKLFAQQGFTRAHELALLSLVSQGQIPNDRAYALVTAPLRSQKPTEDDSRWRLGAFLSLDRDAIPEQVERELNTKNVFLGLLKEASTLPPESRAAIILTTLFWSSRPGAADVSRELAVQLQVKDDDVAVQLSRQSEAHGLSEMLIAALPDKRNDRALIVRAVALLESVPAEAIWNSWAAISVCIDDEKLAKILNTADFTALIQGKPLDWARFALIRRFLQLHAEDPKITGWLDGALQAWDRKNWQVAFASHHKQLCEVLELAPAASMGVSNDDAMDVFVQLVLDHPTKPLGVDLHSVLDVFSPEDRARVTGAIRATLMENPSLQMTTEFSQKWLSAADHS